jgi:thiamine-phosphate pyrophosphorylase
LTICLVTDRRQSDVLEQTRRAVDAGVDVIQVRERDLEAAPLAELVSSVLGIARSSSTRVTVNDRLDVAMACGADGVHLRADSMTPADARRLAPARFLVGRSVHNPTEARAAGGADYLIAGTVFPTSSKPGVSCLGVEGLRAIVHASTAPVLAIGGVTRDRLPAIAATGAAGVASIGLFAHGSLVEIVKAARAVFDTAKARP